MRSNRLSIDTVINNFSDDQKRQIWQAAKERNTKTLNNILSYIDLENVNKNFTLYQFTVLQTAIFQTVVYDYPIEIVKILIRAGFDVNYMGDYNRTPLEMAASKNHLELVEILIAAGADVNTPASIKSILRTSFDDFYSHTDNGRAVQRTLIEAGADFRYHEMLDNYHVITMMIIREEIKITYAKNMGLLNYINYIRQNDQSSRFYAMPKDILDYFLIPMITYSVRLKRTLMAEDVARLSAFPVDASDIIRRAIPKVTAGKASLTLSVQRALRLEVTASSSTLSINGESPAEISSANATYLNQINLVLKKEPTREYSMTVFQLFDSVGKCIEAATTIKDSRDLMINSQFLVKKLIEHIETALKSTRFQIHPLTYHVIQYVCSALMMANYLNEIINFCQSLHHDITSNTWKSSQLGLLGFAWVDFTPNNMWGLKLIIEEWMPKIKRTAKVADRSNDIIAMFDEVVNKLVFIKSLDGDVWRRRHERTQMYYDKWFVEARSISITGSHNIFSYANVTDRLNKLPDSTKRENINSARVAPVCQPDENSDISMRAAAAYSLR